MKRKKTNWANVPWTPFREVEIPDTDFNRADMPAAILRNSRYQVTVYVRGSSEDDAPPVHLSFKVHDKQAYHDWRDMQRIKNEICGPECEAVELFPAESRLVDMANQYHLFVFPPGHRLRFGFEERLVSAENWQNSRQRPWPKGETPADAISNTEFERLIRERYKKS